MINSCTYPPLAPATIDVCNSNSNAINSLKYILSFDTSVCFLVKRINLARLSVSVGGFLTRLALAPSLLKASRAAFWAQCQHSDNTSEIEYKMSTLNVILL
jgi:hypothetical protein